MVEDAPAEPRYAGLVTRAVALLVDAAAINVIALLAGGAFNLIASMFGHEGGLKLGEALAGGFAWALWSATYFVVFWTLTGQTPGDRLLGIRVVTGTGVTVGVGRAIRRVGGLVLALIPLGAGFLPVLFDPQRRGLHDRIAGTVVLWADTGLPEPPGPEIEVGQPTPGAAYRLAEHTEIRRPEVCRNHPRGARLAS